MKRPMVIFLAFLIFGIIWGGLNLDPAWFIIISASALAAGIIFSLFFKMKGLVLLSVFFILGFVLSYYKTHPMNYICDGIAESKINCTFTGDVTDVNLKYITVKADDFGVYGKTDRKVKIICYTNESFSIGDTLQIHGRLNTLSPKYNPSDFDEMQYYGCKGIRYKVFEPNISLIKHNNTFFYYMYKLRKSIENSLDSMYNAENAGILKAMLLGNKEYLTDDIKTLYKNAGIYHILAISGLHISLIAAALMLIFRKRSQSIIIICLLFAYSLFTGLSPSAVRAALMMSILIIGRLLGRRYDILSSICFSAFILLIFNPMYISDCSFLYSYGSVIGIALFAKPFSDLFNKIPGKSRIKTYIAISVGTSLSAVIITKIMNMWFFYSFTVYDCITNLFVIPTVFIAIFCGVFSILFYALGIKLYLIFTFGANLVLSYYKLIASIVLKIPFGVITTGKPTFAFAALYIMAIIALGLALYNKRKSVALLSLALFSLGIILNTLPKLSTEIAYLYVGQGDGVIARAGGKIFAVDGGGTKEEIEEADEGTYTMLTYLNYIGENKIDCAFVSHIDNDHMKGIYELIGQTDIGEIYLPAGDYTSELYTAFLEKAEKYNVPITYLSKGDKIEFNKNMYLECLSPSENADAENVNDTSMVIKFFDGNNSFLFTGDISAETEKGLLNEDLKADVLKVAHHGSKYSSSKAFLAEVSPSVAVISCGKNNVYGFPSEETVNNLDSFNIPYYVTSETGAVIVKSANNKIKVQHVIK